MKPQRKFSITHKPFRYCAKPPHTIEFSLKIFCAEIFLLYKNPFRIYATQ